jgi:DNA-binding winged helix-turn-helix (wHTH) protein
MPYYFGDFTLDEAVQELRRRGEIIALEPKAFQVLCYLLQHYDRVVSRDELFAQFWPDTYVSDWALNRCVARIRKALADGRDEVTFIKTVHGRGYRFVAPLSLAAGAAAPSSERPAEREHSVILTSHR